MQCETPRSDSEQELLLAWTCCHQVEKIVGESEVRGALPADARPLKNKIGGDFRSSFNVDSIHCQGEKEVRGSRG